MKLVVSIYHNEQLKKFAPYIDGALLMCKKSSLNYYDLDLEDALTFCAKNKIKSILSMDKLYLPKEIALARQILLDYMEHVDYFYITDIGVANMAISLGIQGKVIFDPKTMITNSFDFEIYSSYGFHACGISSEITLKDQQNIIQKTQKNAFLQIFGKRLMFYSKRHLISLYSEKNKAIYPKEDVYFKEATRKDFFPGFENENGTCMYRSYNISLLDAIDFFPKEAYGFLESYTIDDCDMTSILEIYKNRKDNLISIEEALKQEGMLNLPMEDGFKLQDSVYQKEELKQ